MSESATPDCLPRLLDLEDPPPLKWQRHFWRYVDRWRTYLFREWQGYCGRRSNDSLVAEGVDDIIALAFLMEHLRRSGDIPFSTLSEACDGAVCSTVADVAASVLEAVDEPWLQTVLEPAQFTSTLPLPAVILNGRWTKRLADATQSVFRGRGLPLSFFGDFHQLCTANALVAESGSFPRPSRRRARGMFYTPSPIVDYVVETSLSQLLADQAPGQLSRIRILDPSCGCGAFLIGCLRFLNNWNARHFGTSALASQQSVRLMERVFCGCDIDPKALRWTANLLLLAAWQSMKGRTDSPNMTREIPLPDHRSFLHCRSFLELSPRSDVFLPESGYDAIVGGPPFVRLRVLHRIQGDRLRQYRRRFLSARRGQFDMYMLFVEQALDLLKPGGLVAFSLSNSFLRSDSGRIIRGYIAANASVEEIVEFDDPRTYPDAATQIALLRVRKTKTRSSGRYVLVRGRGGLRQKLNHVMSHRPHSGIQVVPLAMNATVSSRWRLAGQSEDSWIKSIQAMGVPLGRLVSAEYGPATGADDILLLKRCSTTTDDTICAHRRGVDVVTRFEADAIRTILRARQVKRCGRGHLPNVCPFPYDDRGAPLSAAAFRAEFPVTYGFLVRFRTVLSRRKLAKGCPWYSTFVRLPGRTAKHDRLMVARIVSGGGFRLITDSSIVAHSSVAVLTPRSNDVDVHLLLGVLNSRVFARYVELTMPRISAGRFSLRLARLRRFPVPIRRAGATQSAGSRIGELVRESLAMPADRHSISPVIEAEVQRMYGA